jgi:hypothetical protein
MARKDISAKKISDLLSDADDRIYDSHEAKSEDWRFTGKTNWTFCLFMAVQLRCMDLGMDDVDDTLVKAATSLLEGWTND